MKKDNKTIAEVYLSCGRYHLSIVGIPIVMEGDRCRASLPEECLKPISDEELKYASIEGESIKDMPIEIIRFFRGDNWTEKMLRYVADKINKTTINL